MGWDGGKGVRRGGGGWGDGRGWGEKKVGGGD